MSREYVETFTIFYTAHLILRNKARLSHARVYEDSKLRVVWKRTLVSNDTIAIFLKKDSSEEARVYEATLYPLPFRQLMFDQIYLKGNWEKYLKSIGEQALSELKRHEEVESFGNFLYNFGPSEDVEMPAIKIGEIDDSAIFEGNNQPRE